MDKKRKQQASRLAAKNFQPADYNKKTELSQGLAETHEQVSDTWTEGTIDYKQERDRKA